MSDNGKHTTDDLLDDPQLTAYALGELDADESRAIRERIAGDDAAHAYVREIRAAADQLGAALKAEAERVVPDAETDRRQLETAGLKLKRVKHPDAGRTPRSMRFPWGRAIALAACLAIGVTMTVSWTVTGSPSPMAPSWTSGQAEAVRGDTDDFAVASEELGRATSGTTSLSTELQLQQAQLYAATNRETDIGRMYLDPGRPRGDDPIDHAPHHNTETYDSITDNPFTRVVDHPLSTFSIDVDTASYANVRRMIRAGQWPPRGAVRIEEFVNYFGYAYPEPAGDHPVAAHVEVAGCPWAPDHRLVRVALQAKHIDLAERPASNLVFLLDVSGSMNDPNKLPLVKEAMKMLVGQLDERDSIAIVVYAGSSGLALPCTSASDKRTIYDAIDRLGAGGSTAGAAGIQLAYQIATDNLIDGGVNRVILATDGDFNVGVTDRSELVKLIEQKRETGVFLSILGFGMGNYKDATMEQLSNAGNGNYAYIDTRTEARKALVEQLAGTLVTVAKDVKLQLEFNPAAVHAYRLIGYENRLLAKEDFNDDTKDAGEVGAGHSVTAFYEVVPAHVGAGRDHAAVERRIGEIDAELQSIREFLQRARLTPDGLKVQQDRIGALEAERAELTRRLGKPAVDPLKYQHAPAPRPEAANNGELLTVKLRYKRPDATTSVKLEGPVRDAGASWNQASPDFRFAASVAAFGMILRDSPHRGDVTLDDVETWAAAARRDLAGRNVTADPYRAEFIELVRLAKPLPPIRP